MKVAKISAELAEQIKGKPAGITRLFNPVEDADGNFVISLLEALALEPEQYEQIDFKYT